MNTAWQGMSLREAVAAAHELGARVEWKHANGELVFRHPEAARPIAVNGRRKDASRRLVTWLRQLGSEVADG